MAPGTTGSASSIGLISGTALTNAQAGSISALGGKGGGTLTNASTSTVGASGDATSHSGDVPAGAGAGSAPASAIGAATTNSITDISAVSVSVGGVNEAPITVLDQHTRQVRDEASASATSGSAGQGAVTGAANGVTPGNTGAAVTPTAGDAASVSTAETGSPPSSCTGHAAGTTITGSAEKTVAAPVESGQPIDIGISQRAKVTNTGSTSGAPAVMGSAPIAAANGLSAAAGGGAGATGKGLAATNNVENTALVDISIGGNNYAPINVAVNTITTIVNAARAVVETAAGGTDQGAGGDRAGLGAAATNNVNLGATGAVDIPGDNHNPIRIVLDIGAELWNRGAALLGFGQGAGAPGSSSATGLQVENILKLLGRASVRIGGSNYAPIDINVILQNLIYNEGVAEARSAGQAASEAVADAVKDVSSGPASCLSLLSTAGIVNGQVANVKIPSEALREQVLAANTHVVDVQGLGTARCSTGDVVNFGGGATSGDVIVGSGGSVLAVVTTQVADTSAKSESAPDPEAPAGDGTDSGTTPGPEAGQGNGSAAGTGTGPGAGTGTGTDVQVVVAVTATPVARPGAPGQTPGGARRNIQYSIVWEERWEWVVVWQPLYVIYTRYEQPVVQEPAPLPEPETETTTSMAGAFTRPVVVRPPTAIEIGGLDLLQQIQLALLSLLAFLLVALLKRRLRAALVRKAAQRLPQLQIVTGGTEAAAE